MRTYTFVIENRTLVHVDLHEMYGYNEARELLYKIYPQQKIEFLPTIVNKRMLQRAYGVSHEIKTPFEPYGFVCTVDVPNWEDYVNA